MQARTEARERAVPLSVHLADVLSAGFGTLPFIGAIRKARLESVSFAGLPLVDQDVNVSPYRFHLVCMEKFLLV